MILLWLVFIAMIVIMWHFPELWKLFLLFFIGLLLLGVMVIIFSGSLHSIIAFLPKILQDLIYYLGLVLIASIVISAVRNTKLKKHFTFPTFSELFKRLRKIISID